MILTQTSVIRRGQLATFQLQEIVERQGWKTFRVLRLDWIEESKGYNRRKWELGWNGVRLGRGEALRDLGLKWPVILRWVQDEIADGAASPR